MMCAFYTLLFVLFSYFAIPCIHGNYVDHCNNTNFYLIILLLAILKCVSLSHMLEGLWKVLGQVEVVNKLNLGHNIKLSHHGFGSTAHLLKKLNWGLKYG